MKRTRYLIEKNDKPEIKYHDRVGASAAIGLSGFAILSLVAILQGAAIPTYRIGNKIRVRKILFNLWLGVRTEIEDELGLISNNCICAVDLIIDKQCNGTGPIIHAGDNACFVSESPLAFQKTTTMQKYKILDSKKYHLSSTPLVWGNMGGELTDGTGVIATQVELSKNIVLMAFERGLEKSVVLEMLTKPDLDSAKLHMVNGMTTNVAPVGSSSMEKKDPWAEFSIKR